MDHLLDLIRELLTAFALAVPRVAGAFSMLAFLGAQTLGGNLGRNSVATAMSLIAFPVVLGDIESTDLPLLLVVGIAVKELLVGMAIGFIVTAVFWGIQAVGAFIDNQRGSSIASSLDPLVGEQSSIFGLFLTQTLVAVFFVTGLFTVFMEGIYASYRAWPVTSFFPAVDLALVEFMIKQFLVVVLAAVVVGGPIVIAMFLSEFGLGLIGRFAPQLNVFFLSMPIKSAVSNVLLILFLSIVVLYFADLLRDFHVRLTDLERAFG